MGRRATVYLGGGRQPLAEVHITAGHERHADRPEVPDLHPHDHRTARPRPPLLRPDKVLSRQRVAVRAVEHWQERGQEHRAGALERALAAQAGALAARAGALE